MNYGLDVINGQLLLDGTVHRYTAVGAHRGTRGATYTLLRLDGECEMIGSVVHFLGLERQYVTRTRDNAKVTTLAPFLVYVYRTSYFGHSVIMVMFISEVTLLLCFPLY